MISTASPPSCCGQIHVNDKIVAVQQEGGEVVDIVGMKLRRIVDLIRGAKGTKVTLTVQPHNAVDATQTKLVHITRDVVKLDESRATATTYDLPAQKEGETVRVGVIHSLTKIRGFLTELKSFLSPDENDESISAGKKDFKDPDLLDPNQGQLF